MKRLRTFLGAAVLACLAVAGAPAPAAAQPNTPLHYTFTKTCTLGAISLCTGAAAGDVSGTLVAAEQPGTWWSDGVGHITFVESIGGETMLVSGIFNTNTGLIVMNGRVTEGPNTGAQTHHSARVVGFESSPDGALVVISGAGFIAPGSAG
jgi:hypothetical protein